MSAAIVNLEMVQSDTPTFIATITDTVASLPVDLTGASIWFTGKKEFFDEDVAAVFQKTVGDGITITDAAGGVCEIALVAADTAAPALEKADFFRGRRLLKYDLQIKTSAGQVFTTARGEMDVLQEATQAG